MFIKVTFRNRHYDGASSVSPENHVGLASLAVTDEYSQSTMEAYNDTETRQRLLPTAHDERSMNEGQNAFSTSEATWHGQKRASERDWSVNAINLSRDDKRSLPIASVTSLSSLSSPSWRIQSTRIYCRRQLQGVRPHTH